jgi:hypothetical protein
MSGPSYVKEDIREDVRVPTMSSFTALLLAVVAALCVEVSSRYLRRDVDHNGTVDTFCNFFVRDVLDQFGVRLPRPMRANQTIEWLASSEGRAQGWVSLGEDRVAAQRAVDVEGMLVVACWFSRGAEPGHVALVLPSLGEPGTWVAQAGGTNFSRGRLERAFGDRVVSFFAVKPPSHF